MSANTDRRTLLGAGALVAGAVTVSSAVAAQDTGAAGWKAAREEQDDWLDKSGTRHRIIFDTTLTTAVPEALQYAGNYVNVNGDAYGLKPEELSVVVVLRHFSTVYGFSDTVWAKYGKIIGDFLKLEGDVSANPMLKGGDDSTMAKLARESGVQYAICSAATKFMAGMIAREAKEDAKDVEEFLHANAVPGGIFVPAGVVAIDRAQQRGYSFSYVQG